MRFKFAVAFEYDLKRGVAFLAFRERKGHLPTVALFDSLDEAKAWVLSGRDIDLSIFDEDDINYLRVQVEG